MFKWTDDADRLVNELAKQGHSASQIAAVLGTTRNSVIGRAHRQGLALNKAASAPERKANKPKRLAVITVPKVVRPIAPAVKAVPKVTLPIAPVIKPAPVAPTGMGVAFMDLKPRQCRYALGPAKARAVTFCGHETAEGSSWCGWHRSIVYVPKPPKKIDARPFAFQRPARNARILDAAE